MARRIYTVKNTRIKYHDFKGTKFGPGGTRNFTIYLTNDEAAMLEKDGFNVKWHDPDDDSLEPYPLLTIKLGIHDGDGYEYLNPAVWIVGNGEPVPVMSAKDPITPAVLKLLDTIDGLVIESVDVTFNGSVWTKGGNSGVSAYVQSLLIQYMEDPVRSKVQRMMENHDPDENPFD